MPVQAQRGCTRSQPRRWLVMGGQGHALVTFPREKRHGTHRTGGWVGLGSNWAGAENLPRNGFRIPDRPARSELLYRLSYCGRPNTSTFM